MRAIIVRMMRANKEIRRQIYAPSTGWDVLPFLSGSITALIEHAEVEPPYFKHLPPRISYSVLAVKLFIVSEENHDTPRPNSNAYG